MIRAWSQLWIRPGGGSRYVEASLFLEVRNDSALSALPNAGDISGQLEGMQLRSHGVIVMIGELFPDGTSVLVTKVVRDGGFRLRGLQDILHDLEEPALLRTEEFRTCWHVLRIDEVRESSGFNGCDESFLGTDPVGFILGGRAIRAATRKAKYLGKGR